MKRTPSFLLMIAALCAGPLLPATVCAQALPWTYQGKLERNSAPYTGNATIILELWDAAAGGNPSTAESFTDHPVIDGISTVTPTEFTAANFSGGGRWIQVYVSLPGAVDFSVLSPRQRVTHTPLAMHAATAGSLAGPVSGKLSFGSTTRQMIELFGTDYGIGVQAGTLYQRSTTGFAWFTGGTHNDNRNNPGTGGSSQMELSDSLLMLKPGVPNNRAGQGPIKVGFGDRGATTGKPYVSVGEGDTDDELELIGKTVTIGQIDGTSPATVKMRTGSKLFFGDAFIHAYNSNSLNFLQLYGDIIDFRSVEGQYYGKINLAGLSLLGGVFPNGADVAEGFEVSETETLEPGTVVAIDAQNPGKVKRSAGAYDKRVAGIISGAGGVKPGLRLGQPGVLDGDHDVSLAGRVYVKADASLGAIQAGDMLTTSDTPGHAMKVTDHARAQGSILGKAMSNLDSGTGMVLVLVTLQ